MEFTNAAHYHLYKQMLDTVEHPDKDIQAFAFVASAVGKPELVKVVGHDQIHADQLISLSANWSKGERSLIELAFQLFSGGNLYELGGFPSFTTIDDLMQELDAKNKQVALDAVKARYL